MPTRPSSPFLPLILLLSLAPLALSTRAPAVARPPPHVRIHLPAAPGLCNRAVCVPLSANATCAGASLTYHRSCRTGRCVLGGLGAPCGDEVGTGCPADMRCVEGKCGRPGLGQACDTSAQCMEGLSCIPQRDGLGLCGAM